MAGLATQPQKTVFQTPACEVVVEFALDVTWQYRALLRQLGGERRVMLFDDLVEKRFFSLMALIAVSAQSPVGRPCRKVTG